MNLRTLANVCLIIALYYFTYYVYQGIINPIPALGDSWDYHIPIAKTILDGRFLNPSDFKLPQWYYPGSSEAINALFILLHIPLTLSNIFATCVLFFVLLKLARVFSLQDYYAIIFASAFTTLNVVVRWLNAVSIDVWVAVWFALSMVLLENPKKNYLYFAKLGFVLGMLIGSKYTAFIFLLVLLAFYFKNIKNIIKLLTLSKFLTFFVPFSIFGLFWYIRNYIYTQNPFYPLPVLGFPGKEIFGNYRVWNVGLKYPITMFDSALAEYKMWIFVVILAFSWLVYRYIIKRQYHIDAINKLFFLGLTNFLLYFTFPTSEQPWIMVSSFRYSFPAFIPLMLGTFLLAAKYKKEDLVGYLAVGNMIMVTSLEYHPKLVFIYIPLALLIFYLQKKNLFLVAKKYIKKDLKI
ncbi:MAG: hypothetical protein KatS3mg089_0168 [Patescibacteria group bacterium]|nr:MAG: hypothetical protein KatS3mg089_0168 [Patescibacteria group bacterium]